MLSTSGCCGRLTRQRGPRRTSLWVLLFLLTFRQFHQWRAPYTQRGKSGSNEEDPRGPVGFHRIHRIHRGRHWLLLRNRLFLWNNVGYGRCRLSNSLCLQGLFGSTELFQEAFLFGFSGSCTCPPCGDFFGVFRLSRR